MVDEINKLNAITSRPNTSALASIGPRQITDSTKLLSELIQFFLDSIVKNEPLPKPYKVKASDVAVLGLKGMNARVDDMIYEIKSGSDKKSMSVNVSALLRGGRLNFSLLQLDTFTGEQNTKIADYIAERGVEGAQVDYAGNTKHVKSNLKNAEGDAQELLDAINKDKLVLQSARKKTMLSMLYKKQHKNLDDLIKILILQNSINKINEKINRARSLARITDGKNIRAYLDKVMSEDEEFLGLKKINQQPWEKIEKDKGDYIFVAKIKTSDGTVKDIVFNETRYKQALRRFKAYEELVKLDDASLVALRLYTGDAYRITSTIFYNQEKGYRQWTPEQMSNNLLAACVLAHTTTNNATFHAKVTRVDGSPVIPAEAKDAWENKKLIEKLGPTSTSAIGPLADFLKQAKTATISHFSAVPGIDISAISVWKGEAEVLMPPSQLMIVKKIYDKDGNLQIEIEHAGGYNPDDAAKAKLEAGTVIFSSLQSLLQNTPHTPILPQVVRPNYMRSTLSSKQKSSPDQDNVVSPKSPKPKAPWR